MGDPTSVKRHWWLTGGLIVLLLFALAAAGLLAGYLYLPSLATRFLPAAPLKQLGIADFSGRISAIGFHGAAAGPFVFGLRERPALFVGSVTAAYSPGGLRRREIKRVRLRDVVINLTLGPGGITLPGVDIAALRGGEPSATASDDGSAFFSDLRLGRIDIRNATVNLDLGTETLAVPFAADVVPVDGKLDRLDIRLRLAPRDQRLSAVIRVDRSARSLHINLDGPAVAVDAFGDLVRRIAGLEIAGSAGLRASARLGWTPFSVADARLDLTWKDGRGVLGAFDFSPADDEGVTLTAVSDDATTWRVDAAGVILQHPVPVRLEKLDATLRFEGGRQQAGGSARLMVLPFRVSTGVPAALTAPLTMPLDFDFARTADGHWTSRMAGGGTSPEAGVRALAIDTAAAAIRGGRPRFHVTAEGNGTIGRAQGEMAVADIRAEAAGGALRLATLEGRGTVSFALGTAATPFDGEAGFTFSDAILERGALRGDLPSLTLTAGIRPGNAGGVAAAGRLRLDGGRISHAAAGISAAGVRLDLPWGIGDQGPGGDGSFSVSRIDRNQRVLGSLAGRIRHQAGAYGLDGGFTSTLLPGLRADVRGTVWTAGKRAGTAAFSAVLPTTTLAPGTDLGSLVPAASGLTLAGRLAARASAAVTTGGLDGALAVSLKDGELNLAQPEIRITGIDGAVSFPDLPHLRSAPAQKVRFERAAMGDLALDGGSVDFQVESAAAMLIEKGRFDWCGGKVDAGALRLVAGQRDYDVNLYGQRLSLSRILEQLGTVNARGTGTVNGRIPIRYREGNIRFDDGFLFSTPGEGGRIQLTGTDILTRGIAPDSPQFAQVDLAREALKDFAYDWVKLGLASEGENLVLHLQFDGKPEKPLPFVYKKEIGGFVRVEAGGPGSVFQGISLDVNLHLPLDRLLQYKDVVNMIR